jgi:excisionase family DNA binding protein
MIVVRINELADHLGVHRNTIRNWVLSGKLPARSMPGKRYLLTESEFGKLCMEYGLEPESISVKRLPGSSTARIQGGAAEAGDCTVVGGRSERLRVTPQWADICLTCGSCASACPVSGVRGFDPRKAVRMVVLGLEQDLIDSQWPWICTLCGKCEEACPMSIELVSLFRKVRSLRSREAVPGPLHKGVLMCLEKGNNLGIPKEDFVFLCEDLAAELTEDGCPGFTAPIDKKGAKILVTVNSKEPFAEPDDMKFWWRIFHAAGESWTIPSEHWEGVNWGLFTGDDESMKTIVGRLIENMYRLECKTLLLPE